MGEGAWCDPLPIPLVSRWRQAYGLCRYQCQIGLPPWGHPIFPPGIHDYNPKRHNLIEGVNKCMISRPEVQAKFKECHETLGSQGHHWWLQNDWESGGSGSHQPPFPELWDNLPGLNQKTARHSVPSLNLIIPEVMQFLKINYPSDLDNMVGLDQFVRRLKAAMRNISYRMANMS